MDKFQDIQEENKALKKKMWTAIVVATVLFAFLCGNLYITNIINKQLDSAFKSLLDMIETNQALKKLLKDHNISIAKTAQKPLQLQEGTLEDTLNRYLDGTYSTVGSCPNSAIHSIIEGSCVKFNEIEAKEYDSGFQLDINLTEVVNSESSEDYCFVKADVSFVPDERLIDKKEALLGCEDKVMFSAIKKTGEYQVELFGDTWKKYKLLRVKN